MTFEQSFEGVRMGGSLSKACRFFDLIKPQAQKPNKGLQPINSDGLEPNSTSNLLDPGKFQ